LSFLAKKQICHFQILHYWFLFPKKGTFASYKKTLTLVAIDPSPNCRHLNFSNMILKRKWRVTTGADTNRVKEPPLSEAVGLSLWPFTIKWWRLSISEKKLSGI
jgi:hypothetical protein